MQAEGSVNDRVKLESDFILNNLNLWSDLLKLLLGSVFMLHSDLARVISWASVIIVNCDWYSKFSIVA
jgi:hypothetical protein